MRLITRRAFIRLAFLPVLAALALGYGYFSMIRMPGESFTGPLPPLTDAQRSLADELRAHVQRLAGDYPARGLQDPDQLDAAAQYIRNRLAETGLLVEDHTLIARGHPCSNIIAHLPGTANPSRTIIIGAHYDADPRTPGADDNASGCAALLALAARAAGSPHAATVRFCFFVNEEAPYFGTREMGSLAYARRCAERGEDIAAMLSLEMLGYYSDEPGSQRYPRPLGWLYPDTGDFIGFVGRHASRILTRRCVAAFRAHADFPSEGAAPPAMVPGVGWSDHASFWAQGYDAVMVTDTSFFRNPLYHTRYDTPETLDYERMARVVEGLEGVIGELASE